MKFITPIIFAAALSLSACAANTTASEETTMSVISTQTYAATETRLRESLAKRDLKLFTVVDHGAGAKSVGEDIGQSKLFIFGSPKSGTPLMVAEPKLGLELPMKILLHEADGNIVMDRTDIAATVRAYGVAGQDQRLTKISETLDAIMAEAGGG